MIDASYNILVPKLNAAGNVIIHCGYKLNITVKQSRRWVWLIHTKPFKNMVHLCFFAEMD